MMRRGVLTLACAGALAAPGTCIAAPMLIAPHIAGEGYCPAAVADPAVVTDEQAAVLCAAGGQTAGVRLGAFLDGIGPAVSPNGHYALGYMLTLPVLGIFRKTQSGWQPDPARIDARLGLLRDVDRPAVLYLSANHFTDAGEDLSRELAADTANLMWTRSGPLRPGAYFSVDVIAWTLTNYDAPITKLREAGFRAVLDAACRLPPAARAHIAAVDVLGEVHELTPGFPTALSYDAPYDVTDYSPSSVAGFRAWLAARFGTIAKYNEEVAATAKNFDAIEPPSKNIHHELLHTYTDHLDTYAAGDMTVQGWAYDTDGATVRVAALVDGKVVGEVPANLNRTDVAEGQPSLRTPNVGYRIVFDFRGLPYGVPTLDVLAREPGRPDLQLARRHLVTVDRWQDPSPTLPKPQVTADAPSARPSLHGFVDSPADWTSVFYNPLARLWLEWREESVRRYIEHFARIADASCIGPGRVFSHQIATSLNSSWDPDLFAVQASQLPDPAYLPGTTLYGGAAFGDAFFDWERAQGWGAYGVNEMHPTFGLSVEAMQAMLERHRLAGARFVAPYFMSIKPARIMEHTNTLMRRLIRPQNTEEGSDRFYAAIMAAIRGR